MEKAVLVDEEVLGYFKLEGELVKDGYMDARTSAEFLTGLDEVLRLLVYKQIPELRNQEFEVPVRINKGSWEALIPKTIGGWLGASALGVFTTYATVAATTLAQNDFKDVTSKDVFKKAIEGVQWIIRIGKHLGDMCQKKFENAEVRMETQEVGIRNADGVVLFVPKFFLDLYATTPPKVLAKMAAAIKVERRFVVGVEENSTYVEETVSMTQKYIFTQVEDDMEDVLFPEMVHDMPVELIGFVTRGNATANNMGFRYQEHILTCFPQKGSITKYKYAMFSKCRIVGRVDRTDEHGSPIAKRPKIEFTELTPMDPEVQEPPLLSAN